LAGHVGAARHPLAAVPWPVKRTAYLMLLAVAALALAVVVLVLGESLSSDLLAVLALVEGLAIALVALPANGHGDGA
jgi:hypothetical protein